MVEQPPIPPTMRAPGDIRPNAWRGGVIQIKVTNACDLDCLNCSAGVGVAKRTKRVFRMEPEQFRTALKSLVGFKGVIGMFGGNPATHPKFAELCAIFREEIPNIAQRGLWSNRIFGHAAVCRETFSPEHSNLNVHECAVAYTEIRNGWPKANPVGFLTPSHHGPLFGAMEELGLSRAETLAKIGRCHINQNWSAAITIVGGELCAFFCEVAATMAEVEGESIYAVKPFPYWWAMPMEPFRSQVYRYCLRCLVPMNARKVNACGPGPEEYTGVWEPVMVTIGGRTRRVESVQPGTGEPATRYLL